jgi:redox-sensing transcriptional repressor
MKYQSKVSEAVIKRLPRYYRYLGDLVKMGISRVSSKDLSARMGITSSQVRQDFFCFGGFGLQGYGYDVEYLHSEIGKILGLENTFNMAIIGVGHIGQALANFPTFEKKGFKLVGLFDVNPALVGQKIRDIEIQNFDSITEFAKHTPIDIAIICVPGMHAREVANTVIDIGVKGIWNFAPIEFHGPDDVIVENIHLSDSLMVLGYKINEFEKLKEKEAKESK